MMRTWRTNWMSYNRNNLMSRCSRQAVSQCRMPYTSCLRQLAQSVSVLISLSFVQSLTCYSCIEQEAGSRGRRRGSRTSETTGRDGHVKLPLEEFDDCIAFSWLELGAKLRRLWHVFITDKIWLGGILSFPCPEGFVLSWVLCRRRRLEIVVDPCCLRNTVHLLPRNLA